MPSTTEQLAVARQYVDLVVAARYADAWQLLTPERQAAESAGEFAAAWSSWGRLMADDVHGLPFLWPAAEDQVRANVWLERSAASGGEERIEFDLAQAGTTWRISDEHGRGHHERPAPPPLVGSAYDLARDYVLQNYGPLWLSGFVVLHQESFEGGLVVIFRVLNPLLEPKTAPTPTAILLFAQPMGTAWRQASGGGTIGTLAELDRYAVSCAWTWLRYNAVQPSVAAFYCSVDDPRIASIELDTMEGQTLRARAVGSRAVVFPYAWDTSAPWPAQLPRAIRLVDATGARVDLPTSPTASLAP